MTKISELPTDPQDAFEVLLLELQVALPTFPSSGGLEPVLKATLVASIRRMKKLSQRLENGDDYLELLDGCLKHIKGNTPRNTIRTLNSLEDAFNANALEDHLQDGEQEELLNTLDWQEDDRASVLRSLGEARNFVSYAASFDDNQKRRVLHWLGKAENEVFKPRGKWDRFRAAVSEIADTVNYVGVKAEPLAELIQTARTTTQRNITEVRQIAADEKPKQLEPPTPSDED